MDTKIWWQSRTIWAGLITVISCVAGLLGYQIAEGDQQELITMITGAVGGVSGVIAIWGRVKASKSIGKP